MDNLFPSIKFPQQIYLLEHTIHGFDRADFAEAKTLPKLSAQYQKFCNYIDRLVQTFNKPTDIKDPDERKKLTLTRDGLRSFSKILHERSKKSDFDKLSALVSSTIETVIARKPIPDFMKDSIKFLWTLLEVKLQKMQTLLSPEKYESLKKIPSTKIDYASILNETDDKNTENVSHILEKLLQHSNQEDVSEALKQLKGTAIWASLYSNLMNFDIYEVYQKQSKASSELPLHHYHDKMCTFSNAVNLAKFRNLIKAANNNAVISAEIIPDFSDFKSIFHDLRNSKKPTRNLAIATAYVLSAIAQKTIARIAQKPELLKNSAELNAMPEIKFKIATNEDLLQDLSELGNIIYPRISKSLDTRRLIELAKSLDLDQLMTTEERTTLYIFLANYDHKQWVPDQLTSDGFYQLEKRVQNFIDTPNEENKNELFWALIGLERAARDCPDSQTIKRCISNQLLAEPIYNKIQAARARINSYFNDLIEKVKREVGDFFVEDTSNLTNRSWKPYKETVQRSIESIDFVLGNDDAEEISKEALAIFATIANKYFPDLNPDTIYAEGKERIWIIQRLLATTPGLRPKSLLKYFDQDCHSSLKAINEVIQTATFIPKAKRVKKFKSLLELKEAESKKALQKASVCLNEVQTAIAKLFSTAS